MNGLTRTASLDEILMAIGLTGVWLASLMM